MKNIMLFVVFSVLSSLGCMRTYAQEIKEKRKESKEIIIRKNGEKDTKVTVEIKGEEIFVNDKPLSEFKEDDVKIMNRKIIIANGDNVTMVLGNDHLKGLILDDLTNIDIEKGSSNDDNFSQRFSDKSKVYLGVITDGDNKDGAIIKEVVEGSPASNARLQVNDMIYKVDDEKINTPAELVAYVRTKQVGDKLKIYILRNGTKQAITATLAMNKGEDQEMRVFKYKIPNGNARAFPPPQDTEELNIEGDFDGMQFEGFYRNISPRLGIKIQDTEEANGVKILDVEKKSSGASAGLLKDDIIVGIGDKKISNTDDAREALKENKDKTTYSITVKRNGMEMNMSIKILKKLKTTNL